MHVKLWNKALYAPGYSHDQQCARTNQCECSIEQRREVLLGCAGAADPILPFRIPTRVHLLFLLAPRSFF